jgi:hypothetical protein
MPNAKYQKGRRYEYKSRDFLRSHGYTAQRTPASKSPWDIIAYHPDCGWMVVQVKAGLWPSKRETDKICMAMWSLPLNTVVAIHRWDARAAEPEIRFVPRKNT